MSTQAENERLARALHAEGLVPLPELQRLLAQANASGRPLGALLTHRGRLSPADLARVRAGLAAQSLDGASPSGESYVRPPTRGAVSPPSEGYPPAAHRANWTPGSGVAPGGGAFTPPERGAPVLPSRRGALAPGTLVGDYRVLGRLGAGGMGTVYRAEQAQTGAPVALKVMKRGSLGPREERFRREGEAQARADTHPNVVRVRSAGEAGDLLYLAMDLCEGGDFEQLLEREGPLDPERAREVVAALADGLAHVHQQGVLHRDLKPANVLFDQAGVPKLVDFGLARVNDAQTLTKTGALLGTPAYMAPEQVKGDNRALDERVDVHALGLILFEALTGARPFAGESQIGLLRAILQDEAPSVRSLRPEVPLDLERIVERALAKDPAHRFPGAAELAKALRTGESGPRPPSLRRRQSVLLGVVGALALGVLVAALALARQGRSAGPAAAGSSPTPSAVASAPPERRALELAEVRRLPKPAQPAALARLIAAGSEAEGARQLARELAREPLAKLSLGAGQVLVGFHEGQLVVACARQLSWWDPSALAGEPLRAVELPHSASGLVPFGAGGWLVDGPALWDPVHGEVRSVKQGATWPKHATFPAASADGRWLAGARPRWLALCDGALLEPVGQPLTCAQPLESLVFDPRGELLLAGGGPRLDKSAGRGGYVRALRVPSLAEAWRVQAPPRVEVLLAQEERILVGCTLGDLIELDRAGQRVRAFAAPAESLGRGAADFASRKGVGHRGCLTALWASRDGKLLVSGARDPNPGGALTEVRLWDLSSGEHLGWLELEGFTLAGLAVDPERRLLALGGREGSLQLWSLDALETE